LQIDPNLAAQAAAVLKKVKPQFQSINGMPPPSKPYIPNKMKSESNQMNPSPSKFKTNAQPFYPSAVSTNLKNSMGESIFSNDEYSTSSITGEFLHSSQINIGYHNGAMYF
jgi:hypothetical protein